MQQHPFMPSIQAIYDSAMPEPALPPCGQPCPSMETPGVLQDKIRQVQETSQAPLPLAILAGLATSAFLIQGLAKVKKPNGQTVPPSLFCISIAESGERKSTVLNAFTDPIDTFLAKQELKEQVAWEAYQRNLEVWKATRQRLVRAIAKAEVEEADEDEANHADTP